MEEQDELKTAFEELEFGGSDDEDESDSDEDTNVFAVDIGQKKT
jgi:hypothetical protein